MIVETDSNVIGFVCDRLKIFVPLAIIAWCVLVPVNFTNQALELSNLTFSNIDKLSISNIPLGSNRFGL